MEVEKYTRLAHDMHELYADGYAHENGRVEQYEPAEFQMALELALAIYIKAQFPNELDEVFRMHCKSFEIILSELDAKSHPDDRLDMGGFIL